MFDRQRQTFLKRVGPISLAVPVFTTACNLKDTIDYRNTLLRFTDVQIEVAEWDNMPSAAKTHMANQLAFPDFYHTESTLNSLYSSEGIIREMNAAGVDRGIVFSTHAPSISGFVPFERLQGIIEAGDERLWGFASVNVDSWAVNQGNALSDLENALRDPSILGVALSPSHQRFRMDDASYWSIYEVAAAYDAPVLIRTGKSAFSGSIQEESYTNPIALEGAIQAHPNTQFVLSGLGFNETVAAHEGLADCLRLAEDYSNVWLQTGIIGSNQFDPNGLVIDQTARRIKEAGLVERFLFGSGGSFPSGNINHTVDNAIEAFLAADYSYDEALAVFSGNAERLFGLSPSVWP